MKKILKQLLGALVVLALFNVIAFVVPFSRGSTYWVGYCFATFAILLTIGICFKENSTGTALRSRFYGWPQMYIASCYLIVQLIASIVFMSMPSIPVWVAVIICAVLLSFALIGLVSASEVKDAVTKIDEEVKQKTYYIKSLEVEVSSLKNTCEDTTLRNALDELCEAIRFSDPMSHVSLGALEQEIQGKCAELKNAVITGASSDAQSICAEMQRMIAKRNEECKLLKS